MEPNFSSERYKALRDLSQKIAEAIEAVLKIDVTVMNTDMVRIAGTGRYRQLLNKKIERKTAFDYCLNTGKSIVITEAKNNQICMECPRLQTCVEKAEICSPIIYKKDIIGVIGIIAFNDEQQQKIKVNKEIYLNFLQKMAFLIQGKVSEIEMEKKNEILSKRLLGILNTIDEGLIVFGKTGTILYKNAALQNLFKEIGIEEEEDFFKKLWEQQILQNAVSQKDYTEPTDVILNCGKNKYALLVTVTRLINEQNTEYIMTLRNLKKIQKTIMQFSERSQLKFQFEGIIGKAQNFVEVKKLAQKAALSDSNILIYGESGTGKELFARAIHNKSLRSGYPFVSINCGAIPDELLESELFGYEKGAFTGAYSTKIGKFEVAEKGTIFLDEISEMPFRLQVKLLRVLQEKEICRIGSNKTRKVDVRIISATNTDLLQRIKGGSFREDLYYRLNVIPIKIPPLRERKEDILFIAEYFIKYYNRVMGKNILGISEPAKELFLKYPWPGNVRELQNVIEYAVNFETDTLISRELIERRLNIKAMKIPTELPSSSGRESSTLDESLKQVEKAILEDKIRSYVGKNSKGDVVSKVCRDLKISRATFYRKIKDFNISFANEKSHD